VACAVPAAVHAARQDLVPADGGGDLRPLRVDAIVAHQAASAAIFSRAAVHDVQRILVHQDPVARLTRLHGDDVGFAVADADQPVLAILVQAGPPAAGLRLDEQIEGAIVGMQPI